MTNVNKDWKLKPIGNLGKVITGKTPPKVETKYFNGDYMFVSPKDLDYDKFYVYDTETTITEAALRKFKNQVLPPDTIMFTSLSYSFGKMGITKDRCLTNQQINSIIVNKENDFKFIYYLLRASEPYIFQYNSGIDTPIVPKSVFEKINLLVPSLPIQRQIASMLNTYDELIEINNQRIKILEETASQLYKEWFVRMRFPGYKKTNFKKGIPTNWKVKPIGNVIDYNIGGGWGNDKITNLFSVGGYVIRGTDIPVIRKGEVNKEVYRYHKASNIKSRELKEGDIIFETAGGSEGQLLGRICFITDEALNAYGDKVIAASFCKQLRTSSIPSLYLYYFLNYLYDTGMIETFQVQSTGISNYQFEPFLKFQQIILPKNELMQAFHDKVLLIQKQIATIGQQSIQLRQIRDRLLPRLISGKFTLKQKEEGAKVISLNISEDISNVAEEQAAYKKSTANPYFKRRVLAAYIIDKLKDEATFGHVKLMKLMYLCEHRIHIETLSNYHRDAAGPYDNQMLRSIDAQLKKDKWFEAVKTQNGNYQHYTYRALSKSEEYKTWFQKYYSDKVSLIDNLIDVFGKQKTEKVEMVATLYEAWLDLLEKQANASDDNLLNEVLNNWHDSKKRIEESRWRKCISWLKEKQWINK